MRKGSKISWIEQEKTFFYPIERKKKQKFFAIQNIYSNFAADFVLSANVDTRKKQLNIYH